MSVFRTHHNKNYTCVDNNLLRDMNLSNGTIGLACKLLSLPDEWDYSERGLEAICKDGLTAVKNQLKELEREGYLVRTQLRDENGHFVDCNYDLYEARRDDLPRTENPITVNPITDYPMTVNEPNKVTINELTNELSKEELTYTTYSENSEKSSSVKEDHGLSLIKEDSATLVAEEKYIGGLSENSKSYKEVWKFINTTPYAKELMDWFNAKGKGQLSVGQLRAKVKDAEDHFGGNQESVRKAIQNAFMNNWMGFYYVNNSRSGNNSKSYDVRDKWCSCDTVGPASTGNEIFVKGETF